MLHRYNFKKIAIFTALPISEESVYIGLFRRAVAPYFFERNKGVCPVAKIAHRERGTLTGLGSCYDTVSGHFGFARLNAHCNHGFSQSSNNNSTDVKS